MCRKIRCDGKPWKLFGLRGELKQGRNCRGWRPGTGRNIARRSQVHIAGAPPGPSPPVSSQFRSSCSHCRDAMGTRAVQPHSWAGNPCGPHTPYSRPDDQHRTRFGTCGRMLVRMSSAFFFFLSACFVSLTTYLPLLDSPFCQFVDRRLNCGYMKNKVLLSSSFYWLFIHWLKDINICNRIFFFSQKHVVLQLLKRYREKKKTISKSFQ